MKLTYYVVETIRYLNDKSYPGLGTDPNTMERTHFASKKKAKRFIKRFMHSDPEFVKMWVAHITLTKVTHHIKMVKFPDEWATHNLVKEDSIQESIID